MMEELLRLLSESGPHRVVFWMFLAAVAATIVMSFFIRLMARGKKNDTERIAEAAHRMRVSEYDIFVKAAEAWKFSEEKVGEDFKRYLHHGTTPYYVRQYAQEILPHEGNGSDASEAGKED